MSPELNRSNELPARLLHSRLREFLEKHGVEGWPEQDNEDGYRPSVGRNMQGHVYGRNGWLFFGAEEVTDANETSLFEDQIEQNPGQLFAVGFTHRHGESVNPEDSDRYVVSANNAAKVSYSENRKMYRLEQFEIEMLIDDLRGLWELPVEG